ncbi:MAG: glycerol kinase GlpK [Mycoplasmataceae bacterium]|nr:glycerol kinase GlpK [Mycoplasmataceae bacterium]
MEKYILTLDSGTTSCRSLIVNKKGDVVATSQIEITQFFPKSGWVEHDALEIWNAQLSTMQSVKNKSKLKSDDIAALGITNQRETIVVWDKKSGMPIYNAIVWQDGRTSEYCDELIKQGHSEMITKKTGLIINPYFSGTKLRWILNNVPEAKEKLKKGDLLAGTIDTWLLWKLTGGKSFATDVSNASRTLLFNIKTLKWDQEILDLFGIPLSILPKVQPSSSHFGYIIPTHFSINAKNSVPITGMIGDQQSALFGQLCVEKGMIKNTYGTGCFTLVNTGDQIIYSKNKLLSTVAWQIEGEKTQYALEGSVFIAGAAITWLRDSLKMVYNQKQMDSYADLVEKDSTQRVYVVPSFTGLGAPYWDSNSRGAIFGLERGTKREHIVKATLESIAYQANDLINSMAKDLGSKIKLMKVDGGVSNSNYLLGFQASISDLKVSKPKNIETTAMGAAYMAGLQVKFWKNIEEIKKIAIIDKEFEPEINSDERAKLIKGWNQAVKRTFNWIEDIN